MPLPIEPVFRLPGALGLGLRIRNLKELQSEHGDRAERDDSRDSINAHAALRASGTRTGFVVKSKIDSRQSFVSGRVAPALACEAAQHPGDHFGVDASKAHEQRADTGVESGDLSPEVGKRGRDSFVE